MTAFVIAALLIVMIAFIALYVWHASERADREARNPHSTDEIDR